MTTALLALWLLLALPEAGEADGPWSALEEHVAALWRAW